MDRGSPAITRDFVRPALRERHRAMIRALGEAMFSPDGDADERMDALVLDVEHHLGFASGTLRFALLGMLDLIRWLPLFVLGKFRGFDELSREDRVAMLEKMDRSRRPMLPLFVVAYKTLMAMIFFESPPSLALIGYSGAERRRYKALG